MASLDTCDIVSQDSMRTHRQLPDREWRGQKRKKGIPPLQNQESIKHLRQILYLRPDTGEIKPLSMHTICKTNLQASVGEEGFFLIFYLKRRGKWKRFTTRYYEFKMQTMSLLMALFTAQSCLFHVCDHRSVCKYFPNTQI